jgi:hypothetical protein
MPNPRWKLCDVEAQRLRTALSKLPRTLQVLPLPDLGYRGLHLIDDDGQELARLFGGVAVTSAALRLDERRNLELAALRTGQSQIDALLFRDLVAEIMA